MPNKNTPNATNLLSVNLNVFNAIAILPITYASINNMIKKIKKNNIIFPPVFKVYI